MTSQGGSEGEPTLAHVLAAVQALAAGQRTLNGKVDSLAETLGAQGDAIDRLSLNFAAHTELAQARHAETTQALEAIASMVHAQQGQISRSEARVTSRLADAQQVIQALKADIAAHLDDPDAHHRHGDAA